NSLVLRVKKIRLSGPLPDWILSGSDRPVAFPAAGSLDGGEQPLDFGALRSIRRHSRQQRRGLAPRVVATAGTRIRDRKRESRLVPLRIERQRALQTPNPARRTDRL